jgi:DNA (cytosine-5)-methyltransferase 1
MAQKLVEANCSYLKAGERIRNMMIDDGNPQLRFA